MAHIVHVPEQATQGERKMQSDVQEQREKMERIRGKRRFVWTHPIFLIAIALIIGAYMATYW
ncbi:hypothetical protein [Cupriavidus pampae]|nr:hypothetical protein [Cupriavidus pampae]